MKIHRGTWRAGNLPGGATYAVLGAMVAGALARAWVYLTYTPESTSILIGIEESLPLTIWGLIFILGCVLAVAGMVGRWYRMILSGAMVLGAVYLTLSVGVMCGEWSVQMFRYLMNMLLSSWLWGTVLVVTYSKQRRKSMMVQMVKSGELERDEGDD